MTQTGPAAQDSVQDDVLLPQGWNGANQAGSLLFRLDGLELHLIPGSTFEAVADAVGTLRESTYRQQLSGSGSTRDLDGRDGAYDHLILLEPSSGTLAGSARLQFIPQGKAADDLPGSQQSYLEHVYPASCNAGGAEPPRGDRSVALARRFQRQPHSDGPVPRVPDRRPLGFSILHGLVSYNHFAYSDAVNTAFEGLDASYQDQPGLPSPRHPISAIQADDSVHPIGNVQALELAIERSTTPTSACRCCCASTST